MVSINDLLPPAKNQVRVETPQLRRPAPQTLASRRGQHDLSRPSSAERQESLAELERALESLIAAQNGSVAPQPKRQTIEYATPGASRTLRIVEQENDPLEPPRHRYKKEHKVVQVNSATAAPILRHDARLSAEEKQQWAVPASVSNWKNPRGFLIDLDHRAAAEKLLAPSTSARHADLASALSSADMELQADKEDRQRAQEQTASRLEEQQRLKLRLLAQKSNGQKRSAPDTGPHSGPSLNDEEDLFDSRLFHKSKRRHDIYDKPLFAAQGRSFQPRGELQELKPVEFEEAE